MSERIAVACVECGDYQGRGAQYVRRLHAAVRMHLSLMHDFVIFTDRPECYGGDCVVRELSRQRRGWWSKVELFAPEAFAAETRVLFIDLDSLVVGPLAPLFATTGIVHLRDWGWQHHSYGSCVMVWDAGEHASVYEAWTDDVPRLYRGDQDWMTHLGGWRALPPPPMLCSYRYHCARGVPDGASIIPFHGQPKPHNAPREWRELWATH